MGDSIGPILGGAGVALGGAASVGSIIAGKNAQQENTDALKRLLNTQTSSAEGILGQTGPLRAQTAGNLAAVLAGGRTNNLRVFAPEREAVEQQFSRARDNLIEGGARGGVLTHSLNDLNIARAQTVSGQDADVRKRAFEDAIRIGFGAAPSAVFPAFQGSANILANLASQGGAQAAAGGAGLGSVAGLGALLALKNGKGGGGTA